MNRPSYLSRIGGGPKLRAVAVLYRERSLTPLLAETACLVADVHMPRMTRVELPQTTGRRGVRKSDHSRYRPPQSDCPEPRFQGWGRLLRACE